MIRFLSAFIVLVLLSGVVLAQGARKQPTHRVAPADVKEMLPEAVVAARQAGRHLLPVDVRPAAEYKAGHSQDAISVPAARLLPRMKDLELPKTTEIVTIARPVALAEKAARQLAAAGYYVIGYCDFDKWEKAGLPVEKPASGKQK